LQGRLEDPNKELTDDSVQQMLQLAERLREANGGELDDSAILAVSEATGAPVEYVRLALRLRSEKKQSLLKKLRSEYLSMDPDVRRNVAAGVMGMLCAFLSSLDTKTQNTSYGIFGMLMLVAAAAGLYNLAVSKDSRSAAIAGAIFGGLWFAGSSVFAFLFQLQNPRVESLLLIPASLGGALMGLVLQKIVDQYRGKLGLKDPVKERQDLLRQLVTLQEKLRSGEQSMTFLSVDIVGSTRMKEMADPLSIEFTFNEYHSFIDMVTRKYGGRVHSTAGDGLTCAFDHPQQAYGAARNIQAGMIELNTFRNKVGVPIVLRCGIHTGTVMAPNAEDIKSVNFAHVIDIAAHLQKACPPGGVAVSEAAAMLLPGGPAALGPQLVEAMGVRGVVWTPKQPLPQPSVQPPAPPMELPGTITEQSR
jgi:class 3 adenylate cyclase